MTGIFRGAGTSGTGVPQDDVSTRVKISGDTMTGALNVPAGATGAEVPQRQEVDTALALKANAADSVLTGTASIAKAIVGNQGTEGTGINISGVTYESTLKVSDIDGTNFAQNIIHRHSTTLEPLILGARSNSDTTSHSDVTAGQNCFTVYAAGWAGSNYKLFGNMSFGADSTGTISNTSAPGKFTIGVTPDGGTFPVTALSIDNAGLISGKVIGSTSQTFSVAPATSADHAVRLDQVGIQKINDFRLTLTTGLPVTSADVTAATTIYCAPYKGNNISLYDGSAWHVRASTQMSLAIGTLASATIPQDIFCYDNAGTPTLEILAWSTINARATALAYQDGVLVKSGAVTRRYLGSFCPTATTTTEDSQAKRYLWNYYNRIPRLMLRHDTTASWTYATFTWRQARADTNNQLNFFVGYVEDMVSAQLICSGYTSSAGNVQNIALGVNSITTPSGEYYRNLPATINESKGLSATLNTYPILGLNYIAWLEEAQATGTFFGWDGAHTGSGISGGLLA